MLFPTDQGDGEERGGKSRKSKKKRRGSKKKRGEGRPKGERLKVDWKKLDRLGESCSRN